MENLFYLSSLLFIFKELGWVINPKQKTEEIKKFSELSKQHKSKKWNEYSAEYKSAVISSIPDVIIFAWLFVGLFTSQWVLFLFIICFNIVVIKPISIATRYGLGYVVIHWVNSVIGLFFGIFLIVNHYHLKLSFTKILMQLLS